MFLNNLKAILIAGIGFVGLVDAQTSRTNNSEIEEELRLHLRKLDRWGLTQLLFTEKQVDQRQMDRARNSTNPEELFQLAQDEDESVRFYVSANKHTPLDVQMELAQDLNDVVRSGLASSLQISIREEKFRKEIKTKIATKLMKDEMPVVRLALANNIFLTGEIYDNLAMDADPVIRLNLSENPRASRNALTTLSSDEFELVRENVAKHHNTPRSVLTSLSTDQAVIVRAGVATNINVPATLLEILGQDSENEVLRAVARQHNTRLVTLKVLVLSEDSEIQLAVAKNPNTSRELLTFLATGKREESVKNQAQSRLEPILRNEIREDVLERWNQ
ncbi:MAG: hypothetical protein VX294_13555 [Candidatus Latescibacterota bacterium]|nr:hypothetical protein [Candidatus Latescibacterota bacterium]